MEHTNQLPLVSHILLSVKINHNWSSLVLTVASWERPSLIWALTLALIQFVRLLLTHSCLCKRSPHTECRNTQTAALWPSGCILSTLLLWRRVDCMNTWLQTGHLSCHELNWSHKSGSSESFGYIYLNCLSPRDVCYMFTTQCDFKPAYAHTNNHIYPYNRICI